MVEIKSFFGFFADELELAREENITETLKRIASLNFHFNDGLTIVSN